MRGEGYTGMKEDKNSLKRSWIVKVFICHHHHRGSPCGCGISFLSSVQSIISFFFPLFWICFLYMFSIFYIFFLYFTFYFIYFILLSSAMVSFFIISYSKYGTLNMWFTGRSDSRGIP